MTIVAHFINPFLPLTQNWIYNQLRFNTQCKNIVLCQTLANREHFPYELVFPAFPQNSCTAKVSMLAARLRARYSSAYYLSIIEQEAPDVLHGHFSWESWRNIRVVEKTRLPLLTTFYGLDVNKLSRRMFWKKRYEHLFEIGALFSVEGEFMAQALAGLGCPAEKIRVVHLGVDIERIRRQCVAKTGEAINILFVGLEREKKGSIYAATAFARVARSDGRCRLHLVGDGRYTQAVRAILLREGVMEQTTFHGYVSFEEYSRLLGRADILLAPSVTAVDGDTEGGSPVVVTEAQAAGIPVVGTIHCDIPNIVKDKETGLLCAERDEEALAENLKTLVRGDDLRKTMGEAARRRAEANFSIQTQVKKLNALYQSLKK